MPDSDKLYVYERIRTAIEQESIFSKVSFYLKVGVYSLFLLFIFFGLVYFPSKKLGKGIKIVSNGNSVVADYIWKVITSTGQFAVYQNSKKINTNLITEWSILKVSKNSNLTLKVNSWIKLYIVWPSEIILKKYKNSNNQDVYVLNMLDGDYLTVKSNIAKDKIVIKSKYLNIESDDKEIDLKYVKTWDATIVENNWWDLIVKNKDKILTLWKKEKLILSYSDKQAIKNIFNDNYKKYQLTSSWIKIVLTSSQIKKLSHILEKKMVIIAVWKYVLWTLNHDKNWEQSWKKQLLNIILSTYKIFGFEVPKLIQVKINNNLVDNSDLENLVDNLLTLISQKYVIPDQFEERLKVILAYLIILEKAHIDENIPNLSYLLDYIWISKDYKKKLLTF